MRRRFYRNGLGFVGPTPVKPAPAPAPAVSTSGQPTAAPYFATASGFAKRPISPVQYSLNRTGAPRVTPGVIASGPIPQPYVSFYDEARRFQFTPEQIRTMKDEHAARVTEFNARQGSESGDGIVPELEQQAKETNAIDNAIDQAGSGTGLPSRGKPIAAPASGDALPLAALAALLYFLI